MNGSAQVNPTLKEGSYPVPPLVGTGRMPEKIAGGRFAQCDSVTPEKGLKGSWAEGLRSVTCHTRLQDSVRVGARFAQCDNVTPGSLKELGEEIKIIAVEQITASARIGLLLAVAKRDHFRHDTAGWAQWAEEVYPTPAQGGKGKYHLTKIGGLLLTLIREEDAQDDAERLMLLEIRKLHIISQLSVLDVRQFLKAYTPEKMSRAEVTEAVNRILGKEAKRAAEQDILPGWHKALDILYDAEAADWDMIGESMTQEVADRAVNASFGLMTAAVSGVIHTGIDNVQYLLQIETHIRKEADRLRAYREKQSTALIP